MCLSGRKVCQTMKRTLTNALRVLPACFKPWTQLEETSVLETMGGVTTDDIRAMVGYPGSIHFILKELRSHTGFGAIG